MKTEKNIFAPTDRPLDVAVLVLDDCNMLSLAAAVDPMRAANRLSKRRLFDWRYVTAFGDPALLTSGLTVAGTALSRLQTCDLLMIIAGFNLKLRDTPALRASLRRIAASGATIAGVDGGPWLMAAAGVLDDFTATTHWEDLDNLSNAFPAVTVVRNRFHIDRTRMTSGGATPAIDMMLHLIKTRHGAPLAARVAGAFIYDTIPDPTRAQSRSGTPGHSPLTARVSALMEQTLDAPLPMPELARHTGVSPRSLQSQFRTHLNTTPKAHYLSLRLSEAMRLVSDTDLPLLDVALATGFGSAAAFARAFHAAFGRSARAIRRDRKGSI